MLRFALAAALGFAAVTVAGVAATAAQEKKSEPKGESKTLEGTLVCTKCSLKETKSCGNALVVKDGDKKVTYYLVDKAGKEPYHKECCTADVAAKVTGKVVEADKKMTIEDPKVDVKK